MPAEEDAVELGSCFERFTSAVCASSAFGAVVGCARAAWGADAPAVFRSRSFPAVAKTAGALASGAALFGAIGGAYASVTCAAESARNARDAYNGALGGLASGAVVGLRNGKVGHAASAGAAVAGVRRPDAATPLLAGDAGGAGGPRRDGRRHPARA